MAHQQTISRRVFYALGGLENPALYRKGNRFYIRGQA